MQFTLMPVDVRGQAPTYRTTENESKLTCGLSTKAVGLVLAGIYIQEASVPVPQMNSSCVSAHVKISLDMTSEHITLLLAL